MTSPAEWLSEVEGRAAKATEGPWRWRGNVSYSRYRLAAWRKGIGEITVMDFARAGMQGAQPRFATDLIMQDAKDLARFEVCPEATSMDDSRVYRSDIIGFRHPDAEFIAHARQDVEVMASALRAVLELADKAEHGALRWQDPLPVPEWVGRVREVISEALKPLVSQPKPPEKGYTDGV